MKVLSSIALALCAMHSVFASEVLFKNPVRSREEDLIRQLPGLNTPITFGQYSGYLNADESETPKRFLHYWLTESQNDPDKDPVLLWLNGGPGCSSLGGFFGELGPFSVNDDGKTLSIRKNPWNKNANVIFLESPTSVGFSYATQQVVLDDNTTAKQNHIALKSFLRKFPQFANRPFYISGESYGGVYLPTLGLLLDDDPTFNFKGIAIGNGYLDAEKLGKTLIFFGYYHGLFGKSDWDTLSKHCCHSNPPSYSSCDFLGLVCTLHVQVLAEKLLNAGINPYNFASDCAHPGGQYGEVSSLDKRLFAKMAVTRALMEASLNFTKSQPHPFKVLDTAKLNKLGVEPPCEDDTALIQYLDSQEVRQALHIPREIHEWAGPCAEIIYAQIYPQRKGGLAPQMQKLIDSKRNLSVLIYNGDLDLMCNFYGDELFSDDLNRPVLEDYTPWKVNDQVAGFYKTYDGFVFATVKGAGHMVPTDKEVESLEMITKWLLV